MPAWRSRMQAVRCRQVSCNHRPCRPLGIASSSAPCGGRSRCESCAASMGSRKPGWGRFLRRVRGFWHTICSSCDKNCTSSRCTSFTDVKLTRNGCRGRAPVPVVQLFGRERQAADDDSGLHREIVHHSSERPLSRHRWPACTRAIEMLIALCPCRRFAMTIRLSEAEQQLCAAGRFCFHWHQHLCSARRPPPDLILGRFRH